ncbi:MAG TPA: hypothetical protein VNV60_09210 [Holophagaceae bacterium]|nr:hypothetical protein [Holophagaceae bacterium]
MKGLLTPAAFGLGLLALLALVWGVAEGTLSLLRRNSLRLPAALEVFASGAAMTLLWIAGVAALVMITREGNAGLWIVFTPVALFLGSLGGLAARWRRSRR